MHDFQQDFYQHQAKVVVLGYIRPELDYTSRGRTLLFLETDLRLSFFIGPPTEALIDDIEIDKRVAIRSMNRPAYAKYALDIEN